MKIIGRTREIDKLNRVLGSDRPEFIALYGRRRIGKTFLINQLLEGKLAFATTGILEGEPSEQMFSFHSALQSYGSTCKKPRDWFEAFGELIVLLEKSTRSTRVIFIDELPCFDTSRSRFVMALGHFWNSWASRQSNVKLIVCGSATSWMVKNIIDNHGGLHNRITCEMHLTPFTLNEVEQFLKQKKFTWSRHLIALAYMTFGGIPYYLDLLDPTESLAQNIDRLFFAENATLRREYDRLFKSLFKMPEIYVKIIELLSENKKGLTRQEIAEKMCKMSGGTLTSALKNLQYCDFIRRYNIKEKKIKTNGGVYQLMDFFVHFVLHFSKKQITDDRYWSNMLHSATVTAWQGVAFERLVMAHIAQVKRALGIYNIHTEYFSWRSKMSDKGAQIDLVIDRADRMTHLCEIKFGDAPFRITKSEDEKMRTRIADYQYETNTKQGIIPTFVTAYGLATNEYSQGVMATVTLDQLFDNLS